MAKIIGDGLRETNITFNININHKSRITNKNGMVVTGQNSEF